MDAQALSNAFMSSFPGIQANSFEVVKVQNGLRTTTLIDEADFTRIIEATGKLNKFMMLRDGESYYNMVETITSISKIISSGLHFQRPRNS